MRRANLAKQTLDSSWSSPGAQIVQRAQLSKAAALPVALSYLASADLKSFSSAVLGFQSLFASAVAEIVALKPAASFPPNALVQWWSEERQDSCLCSHSACNEIQAQSGYSFVRIEGFAPSSASSGTVALVDDWNSNINDNLATTNTSLPTGYSRAIFPDGSVFSGAGTSGTVPLQTWWSAARQDWLTGKKQEKEKEKKVYLLFFVV
jgi:hypothetical protein